MATTASLPLRQLAGTARRGGGARFLSGLLLLVLSAAASPGQATFWIGTGAGSFLDPSNWSAGEPDSNTDASITDGTAGAPTDAQLGGSSGSVLDLTLAANNTLDINLNSTLSVYGSAIANNGTINVTAGSANNTYLVLENSVTLTGSGILNLSYGDHNGNAYVEAAGGTPTLTNAGSTIQGDGIIGNGGLALANGAGGTVNANVSSQTLTLNGTGGITNAGVLEATAGGVLQIASNVANAGGTITASSGTVALNATVTGGTLGTAGTGVLETSGSAGLDGVTLASGSTYTGPLNTATTLSGTITNHGTLLLNAGSANNTFLYIATDTTLQGGGTVTLNSGDTNGFAFIEEAGADLTLTNVDNLIQGYGDIGGGGLALVNAAGGTLNADVSGYTLTLDGTGGITNPGLLEATLGGVLHLAAAVNNLGGSITANAGTVNVSATIQGGTLNSAAGGVLETSGTATLDGSSQGPLTLSAGTTYTATPSSRTNLQGTIVDDGNLQVNAGSANNTVLALVANTSLQGPGTVTLNSGDTNGLAFIQESGGSFTLTNKLTIQGYGEIGNGGLTLVNAAGATIDANVAGRTLTLNPGGGFSNPGGTLLASGGGLLALNGSSLDNAGGTIEVSGASSAVQFVSGATIEGGTLTTLNGGTLGVPTTSVTLDGSTAGALTLSAGSTFTGALNTRTSLLGTIVNQGTIQLNAGSANNTVVALAAATTLQGGGTVILDSGDTNGQAFIQAGAGVDLTDVDNTIEGYGTIGNGALVLTVGSAAAVDADRAARTLLLNGASVANAGTLEATNGGTLQLATIVANTGTVAASGGTVDVAGGTVEGGTLAGPGLETTSTATLDGTTNGPLTLAPGSTFTGPLNTTTTLLGVITNQGTIQLNAGSANNTFLDLGASTTLQGGGTVALNSGDNNGQAYLQASGAGVTLTNADNLIEGYGIIGNSALALINEAAGIIAASGSGQTLQLNATGPVTNDGTFEGNAADLLLATDPTNLAGGTLTGGTWLATNGGTISFASAASAVATNDATLVLDGAGAEIQTKTGAGGTYQTVEQTLVANDGTLEVTGNRNFAAANPLANNGVIQLGGGTLTAPGLANGAGSSLTGYGTFAPSGGTVIANGALVSPGTAVTGQQIATLTFGTPLTLGGGGGLAFGLKNAPAAVAGTDYDMVVVTGALTITATPTSPFAIALTSINPTTGNPGLANFSPGQAYSWTLVSAGSIAGFNPADFSFNTASFQNPLNGGTFAVGESGPTLTLDFVPVPEPATWLLLLGGLGGLGLHGRCRGRRSRPPARS